MTWVGDGLQLVTTGFSESGMSEVVLRDLRNVSAVVGSVSLPQCVNTLQPFSTGSLLLLAGRGDPMFLTIDPLTLSTLTKSPQGSDQLDCLQSLPFAQNTRQMALLDAPAAGPNEVARFVRLTEDSRLHSVSVVSKEAPKCVRLSTASPLTSTAEVTRWLQDTRQAEVLRCKSALSRPHLSEALLSQHRDLTSTRFPASPRVGPRQFLFGGKSPSTSPSPVGSPPLPPLSLTYSLPSPSTIASPTHRVRSTPASPKTLSRLAPTTVLSTDLSTVVSTVVPHHHAHHQVRHGPRHARHCWGRRSTRLSRAVRRRARAPTGSSKSCAGRCGS